MTAYAIKAADVVVDVVVPRAADVFTVSGSLLAYFSSWTVNSGSANLIALPPVALN